MMTEEEKDELIDYYRHGQCYPMALALSKKLDWDICVLLADIRHMKFEAVPIWPHPVHVCVISPDGKLFDVTGFTTEDDLLDQYIKHCHKKIWNVRFEHYNHDDFLTMLRHLEEGPKNNRRYDNELYSTFDYSHKWNAEDEMLSATDTALEAIDKLDLLEHINGENHKLSPF